MMGLLVVGPHSEHFDRLLVGIHLVNESVLNVDATRIGSGEVAHEFFVWGRVLEGVVGEDGEEAFGLGAEVGAGDLASVFLSLFGEDDRPVHQPGLVEALDRGSAMPLRMDSRMPGMEVRKRVSWMLRQSSSQMSTALERLPVIWMGSWEAAASSRS
jgi:hypothetical protein